MEFMIGKKDFDSAVKQILSGRDPRSEDLTVLTTHESLIQFETATTGVEVPAEVVAAGTASIPICDMAKLKKLSATYKDKTVRIRVADGRVRFQSFSMEITSPSGNPPDSLDSQITMPNAVEVEKPTGGDNRMNEAEMQAELERLRTENAQLKTKEKGGISLKVSEKGALSLYGMGRFPVTLYKEQWLRVLEKADEIKAFIRDNDSKLKAKD